MALSVTLPKSVLKYIVVNYAVRVTPPKVTSHFSTAKIPESLKALYEKKVEQMELRKKKLEMKKKKMDKVQISKERKNKFKSSKGQHNVF
ncbi:conserved Plasmodium protein, unknown function [Plasmodium knowlesi strain H]|uniref:Uncharacterized protein n=3 Tax=Plasmodium knowlesi TaxID=5850 RepID=A0A5K1V4S4_PLAKH|nr:conserved Plasmodium protein, unknown function [Plasmodium knowlesi strain H]OTN67373.1 Uncharacterized protein PKNOH_S06412100 [Plasmodium knowlesi]CAA9987396.1 conserved Plasmodium protein, unknown function [Plasmodium knowlesi strain H]SBO23305.1 conserved Plasmodium protein, unknown function [Plasmodium knowlesi strain H]SBO24343.1 conserved Plasmodium protein, unknown function [Plasmodium knowlesi strain H]VVS76870.1 conserved Plasmodium protein, unknown function [Plasmodium knowlesi s|eukprot:XP_002258399.1 hypothetical protein, conserved in Plasmodium species [Plasmodium knowlesi strain H]